MISLMNKEDGLRGHHVLRRIDLRHHGSGLVTFDVGNQAFEYTLVLDLNLNVQPIQGQVAQIQRTQVQWTDRSRR